MEIKDSRHPGKAVNTWINNQTCSGFRSTTIGNRRVEYGAGPLMVAGIDTPCLISNVNAGTSEPFLGINLVLDLSLLAELSTLCWYPLFIVISAKLPLSARCNIKSVYACMKPQRLMLIKHIDVTAAAFEVGYESSSQFNREYKREFGYPPLRDIERMRTHGIVLT